MKEQIIFIIGLLLLMVGLMCIKKVPEEVSFLRSLVICYIMELCLGAVLAGIYSVIKVPIGLFNMGTGYLVLAIIVWGWIIYHKEIQKLTVYAVDVYAFLCITIVFVIVFFKVFTPEISLVYKNSDPAVHYELALRVMKTGEIRRMYFAELHNSLFMHLLEPFLVEISLYKAFILADSLSVYVNILMFYVLMTTIFQSKVLKVLSPFICILYFLGWPFYSYVVGGYVYFGVGITLFMYVIYLLTQWKKADNGQKKKIYILLVLLGIYGVTICYMLFLPVLCLAIFMCICYYAREKKMKVSKKLLFVVVGVIAVLGIILFCICFFGYFGGNFSKIFSGLQNEGGIHRELYKDFLFLMPPLLFMSWYYYQKKETTYIFLTYVAIGGCTLVAFIFCIAGVMSGYYFYKLYYLNWCFLWLIAVQAIEYFSKWQRVVLAAYGIPVIMSITMLFTGGEQYFKERDLLNADSPSPVPIYSVTIKYMEDSEETAEMDSLRSVSRYINDHLANIEQGIPMISSIDKHNYSPWYKAFTEYDYKWANRMNNPDDGEKNLDNILKKLEESGQEYVLILKTADCYVDNKDAVLKYEAVYDDGYFGLYKMNNTN